MAITISGENNNDRILASDGVIDSLSGFNVVGVITATSFTGDLTGDVTGNLTGNVTGNINNSTLLLQTGGTERVRITSTGKVGINETAPLGKLHIKNGDSGASTVGSSTDELVLENDTNTGMTILSATNGEGGICFGDSGDHNIGKLVYSHADNSMQFKTNDSERLRIDSSGRVLIGTGTVGHETADNLTIASSGSTGISIRSNSSNAGNIHFGDGTSGNDQYRGIIQYHHADNSMRLFTNSNEKLRITSGGDVTVNTGTLFIPQWISHVGDTDSKFGFLQPDIIQFDTAGTTRLKIMNTGQIRIDQGTGANNGIRMRPSGWSYDFRIGAAGSSGGSIWLGQNYDPSSDAVDSSSYGTNYLRFTTGGQIRLGTGATNTVPKNRIQITNDGKVQIGLPGNSTSLPAGTEVVNIRAMTNGNLHIRQIGNIASSPTGTGVGIDVLNDAANTVTDLAIRGSTVIFRSATAETLRIHADGKVTFGASSTAKATVDIIQSGQSATSLSLLVGANESGGSPTTRTNSFQKAARIACPHYTNAEEPMNIVVAYSGSSTNNLYWGGGTGVMNAATSHHFYTAANNTTTNGTERFRIASDGNAYFSDNMATSQPSGGNFGFRMDRGAGNATTLQVENYANDSVNNNATIKLVTNHSNVRIIHHNQGGFYIINSGNGYFHYYQNGQSTFFVDTNGNFCVGTQSASSSTQAKGISLNQDGAMISRRDGVMHYYKSISTGGYYPLIFLSANTTVGSIFFNSGGTQFNTSSDYRRKENVVSLTDGISKLKQLKPYRFNFKDNPSETVDGFLAHEAQEIVPHTVTGTKDQIANAEDVITGIAKTVGEPIYQQMDLSKLVPLLTAALQEEISKRESLEARVATLESS